MARMMRSLALLGAYLGFILVVLSSCGGGAPPPAQAPRSAVTASNPPPALPPELRQLVENRNADAGNKPAPNPLPTVTCSPDDSVVVYVAQQSWTPYWISPNGDGCDDATSMQSYVCFKPVDSLRTNRDADPPSKPEVFYV